MSTVRSGRAARRLKALALATLLCLCLSAAGCSQSKTNDSASAFVDPAILNTVYPLDTVFAQNLPGSSDVFSASEYFAKQFVRENYAAFTPGDLLADYLFGATVPEGVFGVCAVNLMSYYVSFSAAEAPDGLTAGADGRYGFNLQIITRSDSTGRYLEGFVTNQERHVTTFAQLYDFLKLDARFSAIDYPVPAVTGDLTARCNLSDATGALRPSLGCLLDDDTVVCLCYDRNERLADPAGDYWQPFLQFVQPGDPAVSYRLVTLPDGFLFSGMTVENGLLQVTLFSLNAAGDCIEQYYRCTFDARGNQIGETVPWEEAAVPMTLSENVTLTQEDSSISVVTDGKSKTVLKHGAVNEKVGGYEYGYRLRAVIDDHRFLYDKVGYEWLYGVGVYDTETGKSSLLSLPEGTAVADDETTLEYVDNSGPLVLLTTGDGGYGDSGALWLYNADTDTYTRLAESGIYSCKALSDDGSLAAWCSADGYGTDTTRGKLTLYSLRETAVIASATVDLRFLSLTTAPYFTADGAALFFATPHALADAYVLRLEPAQN